MKATDLSSTILDRANALVDSAPPHEGLGTTLREIIPTLDLLNRAAPSAQRLEDDAFKQVIRTIQMEVDNKVLAALSEISTDLRHEIDSVLAASDDRIRERSRYEVAARLAQLAIALSDYGL